MSASGLAALAGRAAVGSLRAARAIGSADALVALLAPLALAAAAVLAGEVTPSRAAAAWSVRIWAAAAALALVTSAALAWRAGSLPGVLVRLAAVCVIAQPFAWVAGRWHAVASIGEHEEDARWEPIGPGGRAAAPDVRVEEVAPGDVRLRLGGREERVPLGREISLGGGAFVRLEGPFPAPRFAVRRAGGSVEAEGFVKLEPGQRAFLEPGILPHRLYVSVPEGEGSSPDKLRLHVQRGKLRILEREVAAGEEVRFEGVSFSFGEGTAWVRVEARREPRPWALLVAAALGAVSFVLALRRRSRAGPGEAP